MTNLCTLFRFREVELENEIKPYLFIPEGTIPLEYFWKLLTSSDWPEHLINELSCLVPLHLTLADISANPYTLVRIKDFVLWNALWEMELMTIGIEPVYAFSFKTDLECSFFELIQTAIRFDLSVDFLKSRLPAIGHTFPYSSS